MLLTHWLDALTIFFLNIYQIHSSFWGWRLYPRSFISSTDPVKFRSIIREIVKVSTKLPIKPIVSGTGLPLPELEDPMASGVSKPAEAVQLFHKLGMLIPGQT
jgi:hypothetical protein